MRSRSRILASLESVYREEFGRAGQSDDPERMARLDFDFQRDQLLLEVLLDLRTALTAVPEPEEKESSLLEKAQALGKLKNLTKLR